MYSSLRYFELSRECLDQVLNKSKDTNLFQECRMFKPIMIFSGKKNHNMARELLVSRPVTQHIHVPLRQWKKVSLCTFYS